MVVLRELPFAAAKPVQQIEIEFEPQGSMAQKAVLKNRHFAAIQCCHQTVLPKDGLLSHPFAFAQC